MCHKLNVKDNVVTNFQSLCYITKSHLSFFNGRGNLLSKNKVIETESLMKADTNSSHCSSTYL